MIKPGEIQQKAREAGVRDQQIEKDYILSWILQGMAQHNQLKECLVFKGGTVLKKAFFEDYRLSEDLDFTLTDEHISKEKIFEWFDEAYAYIKEKANIPCEIIDNNEHEDGGINFYISYTGPLGGQGSNKKVKVDISRSEQLVFEPDVRPLFTPYSDLESARLPCYSLEEILVEKMRSVMQRMAARDFYDIWYLTEVAEIEAAHYANEFKTKCESKNLDPAHFVKKLQDRLPQYKGRWESSLSEQIQDLPDFDRVTREVQRHLKKFNF